MHKIFTFFICIVSLVTCACSKDEHTSGNDATKLKVATFNIRFATSEDTGVRSWTSRKQACKSVIERYAFDVFGLQEVLAVQQEDLRDMLPDYSFKFVGRDDGNSGEAVGIAWRTSVLKCVESGYFWLSPTPDVPSGSKDWGGVDRHRVAAWARFREIASGKEFVFIVTHLEVGEENASVRLKSAELIITREATVNAAGLPSFVVGDMNPIAPTESSMRKFREVFTDAWMAAEDAGVREGPIGSFNGFSPNANLESQSKRGDYIFYKGNVTLRKYKCIDDKFNGQYPSDHVPVMVQVEI